MTRRTVISIGYQRRTPVELVSLLRKYGVAEVVDVRALPLSRRKGFSKTALSRSLASAGIRYTHLRVAGNPYRFLKAQWRRSLSLYRRHLVRNPSIVHAAAQQVNGTTVAFLCFERNHVECHRSVLIEAVCALDANVRVVAAE